MAVDIMATIAILLVLSFGLGFVAGMGVQDCLNSRLQRRRFNKLPSLPVSENHD